MCWFCSTISLAYFCCFICSKNTDINTCNNGTMVRFALLSDAKNLSADIEGSGNALQELLSHTQMHLCRVYLVI